MLRYLKDPSSAAVVVPAYCLLKAYYVFYFVAPAAPGLQRLILLLPCACAFAFVIQPLYDLYFMVLYLFLGISFSKALAFCLNRGPLKRELRFWRFAAVLLLPLVVTAERKGQRKHNNNVVKARPRSKGFDFTWNPSSAPIIRAFIKTGLYVLLFGVLSSKALPLVAREALDGLALYLAVSGLMDACGGLALAALGLETSPAFHEPWMSTSLRELWSKRWNLPAAQPFRWLLYDPLMQGCLVLQAPQPPRSTPNPFARPLAVLAVYTCSGLLHEAAHYLNTGGPTPNYSWLTFFLAQPLLASLQDAVQGDILSSFPPAAQPWVARGITLSLLGASAHCLWFPPCHTSKSSCFLIPD